MFVEFIIPTYDRVFPLKCMLASLTAQTDGDWEANVVIDNPKGHHMVELVESFDDERIRFLMLDQRYNDFGHTPRQMGKQLSKAKYIIMTGDDNYYTPNFVYELKLAVRTSLPGMVYWDMVHSHFDYQYLNCKPANGQIDMGAFATRNDLAKQIDLGVRYDADGWFVNNFREKFPKEEIMKIEKILFVHN